MFLQLFTFREITYKSFLIKCKMIRQFISAEPGKRKREGGSQSSAASQGATSPIEPHSSSESGSDSEQCAQDDPNDFEYCCRCGTYTGLAQCYPCPADDYILVINDDEVATIVKQVATQTKLGTNHPRCLLVEDDREFVCLCQDNQQYKRDPKLTDAKYLWSIGAHGDIFDAFKQGLEERGLHVVELFPAESRGRDDDEEPTHSRIYEITKLP
jgi:hypothetical protein